MHKNFIITINYSENGPIEHPRAFLQRAQRGGFTYGVAQIERGEKGNVHLQAVIGGVRKRFDSVKKLFKSAHIEPCHHPKAAIKYCQKDQTRISPNCEFGESPYHRNKASDIASLNARVLELGAEESVR